MSRRHDWHVDPAAVFTTHGIVAGLAICLQAFTAPGDGVILFTPVYHAFHRVIAANGREIVQAPLSLRADGRYGMDLEALAASLTGRERMLVLCSPHNPGGRVWDADELRALRRLLPDARPPPRLRRNPPRPRPPRQPPRPMPLAAPDILDRLLMLTAATKTFNIAGTLTGNVIIPDPDLRKRFAAAHLATGTSPNRFGALMTTAAYEHGDAWVDALCRYLAGNAEVLAAGIATIPGLRLMPLDATYLAWVDFSGTGMASAEFTARVEKDARIAASHGATFGVGGEGYLRFNIGTPRARVAEAVDRLNAAFADLQ